MMRVVKVLNNSVVLAVEDGCGEVILMGKGIGFGKTIGQVLTDADCGQVFVLRDRQTKRSILQLAAETDERIFEITRRVVDYAVTQYQMDLMEHIYLALTDHLAFAARRQTEGHPVPGYYAADVRRFNPQEYAVGCYALQQIRQELGVELPEDEITNIAFHFINAQKTHREVDDVRRMGAIVDGILEIVKYHFGLEYRKESVSYTRFLTHIKSMSHRLVQNIPLKEDLTDLLFDQVMPKCPEEYHCSQKVSEFLQEAFRIQVSRQELLYLTLHIHLVRREHSQ